MRTAITRCRPTLTPEFYQRATSRPRAGRDDDIISGMPMSADAERRWMAQWRRAGPALEAQRRQELRTMSDAEALAACEALLSLAGTVPISPDRLTDSGLVRQQALFHRRRR